MRKLFTPQDDAVIKKFYDKLNAETIGRMIGRTKGTIRQRYKTLKLVVPAAKLDEFKKAGRYNKGHEPWSKGKTQEQIFSKEALKKIKKVRFKKGMASWNKAAEGEIRLIRMAGKKSSLKYYNIKINGKWYFLHHVIWKKENSTIPKNKIVTFIDGNQMNCVIENLMLITRKENMLRNTIHRYPEAIKKSIYAITSLKKKIKKHEK